MKLELEESRSIGPAEFEISDVPTARGTVSICVDEWPGCEGMSAAVEIDREAATKICEHLISVFGILALQPGRKSDPVPLEVRLPNRVTTETADVDRRCLSRGCQRRGKACPKGSCELRNPKPPTKYGVAR